MLIKNFIGPDQWWLKNENLNVSLDRRVELQFLYNFAIKNIA